MSGCFFLKHGVVLTPGFPLATAVSIMHVTEKLATFYQCYLAKLMSTC